ncbi:hypothetical protein [uncultured Roseibium sp.]|uniref:hypothetical protein n=1 Tax=uncultured Roseibium sp. TaxID=1936171 RepID=UPI00260B69A2|nr:hypothetical protein [uncultured Roseibium sp.]
MQKTFKRETAWAMAAGLGVLCIYGLWSGDDAALEWAKLFTVPVMGFMIAAFGLDAAAKQLPRYGSHPQGPPQ